MSLHRSAGIGGRAWRAGVLAAATLAAGCAIGPGAGESRPEDVRARIVAMIPASIPDREGWAVDIYAAFAALRIDPSVAHLCAVIAVNEQESTFRVDPSVPRLGRIVTEEIDRRAERAGVPKLLVEAALAMRSPDSRSYRERIDAARTEKEVSDLFDDFIGEVPLGKRLLAGWNPVRTGGSMQVSIEFAEEHTRRKAYPYRTTGSIRDEVFTRRGGLYFGIAHLLDYPARYDRLIYRYADFNAGHYASRNAAFQNAVAKATGRSLALDGDLLLPGSRLDQPGATESAVRSLGDRLGLDDRAIRDSLLQGDRVEFDESRLYRRVFELAEQKERRPLPRATVPNIQLQSPKITRPLTTEWFARRVDERQRRCVARAAG